MYVGGGSDKGQDKGMKRYNKEVGKGREGDGR